MSKRIAIVDANGQNRKIKVSNEDEFSRHFAVLDLIEEDGYEIAGYASLDDGKTYTYMYVGQNVEDACHEDFIRLPFTWAPRCVSIAGGYCSSTPAFTST